jgi:acyl-CoA synthetase (AMP-forming)/AMP-acid ligase II
MKVRHQGNIAQVLWETARTRPGNVAVRDTENTTSVTYEQLASSAGRIAAGLLSRGLHPGDRVALLMHNSSEYLAAFFGVLNAGMVVVPLNVRLTRADFEHMLSDAQCAALIADEPFLDDFLTAPSSVPLLLISARDNPKGAVSLEDLSRGQSPTEPAVRDGEDLCSLMYTSGTTGRPKAVMLSHRSWREVSRTARELLGFTEDMAVLHPAPLTHGAGFLALPTIEVGGTNVVCGFYSPALTAEAIRAGTVQGMFLVPSMVRMLLDCLPEDWSPHDSFRWVYYGGSPIDADTLREATLRLNGRLVQSFAQMEAPMFITSLSSDDHKKATANPGSPLATSAGKILPGRRVRLLDASGEPVPHGEVGEVNAYAPQTMLGYWNRPDETTRVLSDGWLRTGDLGRFGDDNTLHIVGRVKDMIVTGGSNVYAREVEEVLETLPGLAATAVIGLPHRVWGEAVTAVLVREASSDISDDSVFQACREHLAGYKVPKQLIWVDELPTNPYGKVLKAELRTRFHTERTNPDENPRARSTEPAHL